MTIRSTTAPMIMTLDMSVDWPADLSGSQTANSHTDL